MLRSRASSLSVRAAPKPSASAISQRTLVTCARSVVRVESQGVARRPNVRGPIRRWQQENKRWLASSATPVDKLKRTPLYNLHLEHGGKLVEFGGHAMPVQYSGQSIVDSSKWTREKASIFDVSHMTQHKFIGEGAAKFLESVAPAQASSLKPFQSTYSALLNDKAGIVDDTIITNITEATPTYYVVTNAGNHEVDLAYFTEELSKFKKNNPDLPVEWEVIQNTGLIALQGPQAADILKKLQPRHHSKPFDLDTLTFGNAQWLTFQDSQDGNVSWSILVSRTGYTGEDGFELSIPHPEPGENTTLHLTNAILNAGGEETVKLAGLGARDALRLEAGLCLHGSDISASTTPIDASLIWIIPKARRTADAGFNGAAALYGPKSSSAGPEVRRVGLILEAKGAAARGHDKIYADAEGTQEIGEVTSGAPSPTLGKSIAMGYALKDAGKKGNPAWIKVRGKLRQAEFVKMPFVPTKYFKGNA